MFLLGMIFQMFGLIFQTQVSNFCLTSRRTGELVLAGMRQNLISTLHHRQKCLHLHHHQVGSEVGGGGVQLAGLLPRHCVLAHTEGVVTVTPCDPRAEVVVNGQRAVETTILQHGAMLRFGRSVWRFIDPGAVAAAQGGGRIVGGGPSQGSLGRHGGSTATLPGDQSWGPGMRSSTANYAAYPPQTAPRGQDAILPAVLEFREDTEEVFFDALTINLDPSMANFKLAPTYTIYMATRFRASTHYRPELVPEERAVRLTDMLNRVADRVLRYISSIFIAFLTWKLPC